MHANFSTWQEEMELDCLHRITRVNTEHDQIEQNQNAH